MSTLKVILKIILPFILLAGLVSCAPAQEPTTAPPVESAPTAAEPLASIEQTLIIGIGRDPGPLNLRDYASQFPPLAMVYEGLAVYQGDGSITPGLATSWETSEDGLTWTFHLRDGVTFHDGTPFDSAAAKWNFEQFVGTERHGWLRTSTVIQSIDTPDKLTIVLHLSEPFYPLLQELTLVRPVRFASPNSVDASGELVKAIGTGPWMVEEYTPEQRESFVPNENYWGEKPTLSKVVFEVLPDAQTRVAALQSHEILLTGGEYIGGIPLESLSILKADPNISLVQGDGSTGYFLMMNYKKAPFDDVNVRKAMNLAIDRKVISDNIFQGMATPATGIFASNIPYVTYPHPEYYTYNPTQAKDLLAQAGWTAGSDGILTKDGKPFVVTIVVDSTAFPQAKSMVEVFQGQLSEIGVKLEIRLTDYGGWSEALINSDYDMATNITYGSPYDPHSTLSTLFTSIYGSTDGSVYISPELDTLIGDVLVSTDENTRVDLYNQIWTLLDENAAAVPVVFPQRLYALDKTVQGFSLAGTEYELALNGMTIGK